MSDDQMPVWAKQMQGVILAEITRARREMQEASSEAAMNIIEARLAKLRGETGPKPIDDKTDDVIRDLHGRNTMMQIINTMQAQIERLQNDVRELRGKIGR